MNQYGERLPYEPPVVVALGALVELTQGSAQDISDDSQGQSYSVQVEKHSATGR